MSKVARITADDLRQFFLYDPETGEFRHRPRPVWMFRSQGYCDAWNKKYAFQVAGGIATTDHGYAYLNVNSIRILAHRAAFVLMTGSFPKHQVDHINGIRHDNRWVNLREVTIAENRKNMARQRFSKTSVMGVSFQDNRWVAQIKANGRAIRIGSYLTEHDAIIARKAAEKVLGYHPNHGREPRELGAA